MRALFLLLRCVPAILLLAALAGPVQADVITFESAPGIHPTANGYAMTITTQGFNFTGASHVHIIGAPWGCPAGGCATNGTGIYVLNGPIDTRIGGNAIVNDIANTIFNNAGDGIRIEGASTTGNFIQITRTYNNGGLGINLVGGTENGFGVTATTRTTGTPARTTCRTTGSSPARARTAPTSP